MRQLIRVLIALLGAIGITIIVKSKEAGTVPVSYTHLTLPTIYSV